MIFFNAVGLINALGDGMDAVRISLQAGNSLFETRHGLLVDGKSVPVAPVKTALPEISEEYAAHRSRNNQLLLAALEQIRPAVDAALARYGSERVGVILGTSISGIDEGEAAVAHHKQHGAMPAGYHYQQQELGDPSAFLSAVLGTRGPAYTISTACTSTARTLISAKRLIEANIVDAVIVGGADSLCRMTLNGFHSLEALSLTGCRPFSVDRDGISIGEAAALFLVSQEAAPVALLGVGESSDAYHMSAPHPEGIGAEAAMRQALQEAAVEPADIGYINLHGTGTPLNDQMESAAVNRVFGEIVPCSSTKHLTGHTLGTCGATEAAISYLLLTDSRVGLPAQNLPTEKRDGALARIGLVTEPNQSLAKPRVLSNSFAFGGNNACLLLGAV